MNERPLPPGEATRLLQRATAGDPEAGARLLDVLYAELKHIASGYMSRERGDHTLQATALVHEAWVRLTQGADGGGEDTGHFLRLAARAMRNVLVDHARSRNAEKRGGGAERKPLDELVDALEAESPGLLAVDEALERLSAVDGSLGKLVELRFFAGLSIEEAARALDISTATVERRWRIARMWLRREMEGGEAV